MEGNPGQTREDLFGIVPLEAPILSGISSLVERLPRILTVHICNEIHSRDTYASQNGKTNENKN